MKKLLLSLCASALITCGVQAAAPAQVTFTVVKFRPVTVANPGTQYTDATISLAAHPLVTLAGSATDAVLHPTAPVDFEIKIESADPRESYTPLGIVFEQNAPAKGAKTDPQGKINFGPGRLNGTTLLVHDHFARKGPEYHYEFFVIIQRGSDGKIGIIDPGILHDSSDASGH